MTNLETVETVASKVDGKVYQNYSGRGMYGKTCLGIVCSDPEKCKRIASKHGLKNASVDNMGLDFIVYWTHIN